MGPVGTTSHRRLLFPVRLPRLVQVDPLAGLVQSVEARSHIDCLRLPLDGFVEKTAFGVRRSQVLQIIRILPVAQLTGPRRESERSLAIPKFRFGAGCQYPGE